MSFTITAPHNFVAIHCRLNHHHRRFSISDGLANMHTVDGHRMAADSLRHPRGGATDWVDDRGVSPGRTIEKRLRFRDDSEATVIEAWVRAVVTGADGPLGELS